MKFKLLLITLCWWSWNDSSAQTSCSNIGFEDGTFNGWTGTTGYCCPISATDQGIVDGRHTIMSGDGLDANTDSVITIVAPGGSYSARLGNMQASAEAEQLKYSMIVDQSNSLLIYRYAVVLEDPFHAAAEQPRFEFRLFGANGDLDPCSTYNVHASVR